MFLKPHVKLGFQGITSVGCFEIHKRWGVANSTYVTAPCPAAFRNTSARPFEGGCRTKHFLCHELPMKPVSFWGDDALGSCETAIFRFFLGKFNALKVHLRNNFRQNVYVCPVAHRRVTVCPEFFRHGGDAELNRRNHNQTRFPVKCPFNQFWNILDLQANWKIMPVRKMSLASGREEFRTPKFAFSIQRCPLCSWLILDLLQIGVTS